MRETRHRKKGQVRWDGLGIGIRGQKKRHWRYGVRRKMEDIKSRTRRRMFRKVLAATLLAEGIFCGYQMADSLGRWCSFYKVEESYHVEWMPGEDGEELWHSQKPIYGVRILPRRLEVQFYQRQMEVK